MAAVVTAVVVVVTLLFLTPLFEVLPQATLGAVVIVAMRTRARGITLWLASINARPLDMIRRLPPTAWESQLFRDVNDAAEASTARTRPEVPVAPRIPPAKGDERVRDPAESW